MDELTIKQEKFCRHFIGPCEGNASDAYRAAYNTQHCSMSTINRNAKALLDNNKIATRIDVLKAEYESQEAITLEEITGVLRRAVDGAAAAGQWSAASQAALGLAKLAGLLIEKRQISADPGADHLDAVAMLAGAPRSRPDDDNVIPLQKTGSDDA
jgi:phage terminase small subunit